MMIVWFAVGVAIGLILFAPTKRNKAKDGGAGGGMSEHHHEWFVYRTDIAAGTPEYFCRVCKIKYRDHYEAKQKEKARHIAAAAKRDAEIESAERAIVDAAYQWSVADRCDAPGEYQLRHALRLAVDAWRKLKGTQ